ncbi:MAG: hypothetical protein WCI31_08885 [Prolixibacteraceae bacterium]
MTKKYFTSLLSLLFFLPGFLSTAFAQKDTTKLNQQVEVVKAYRPSISNAEKISLLPEIGDTTKFRPDLNYQTINHPITKGFRPSDVRSYNQFQREIVFPGYGKISGGFGSYSTPFFDLYVSNPGSQNGSFGIQINHLSSRGSVMLKGGSMIDAPFSYNRAQIFGSYVLDGITISSELSYQRDMNRFYGYPEAMPANILTDPFTKYFNQNQLNQLGYFDLSVKNNATSNANLKFDTGLKLGYFNTSTSQVEKAISLKGNFEYNFGTFTGRLNATFDHFTTDNVNTITDLLPLYSENSSWLQLSPTIGFQNDIMSLEGGMNLSNVFSNIDGTIFKPHPKAKFSLHTSENRLTLYAGADGYLQNNTMSKIAEENRWVNPTLKVRPTNHLNIFYGGIKGKISTPLAFDLGVKYSKTEDQYFYTTMVENKSGIAVPALKDLTYNNAFEVIYDNLSTVDFSGDLTYTTSNLYVLLAGHFYNYQLTSLEKAPYLPDFTLNATTNFKINEKISATSEFFLTGPRNMQLKFFSPIWSSMSPPAPIYLQSSALIDVNIGAKYQFTNKLEFFGRIENLLNNREEVWYGYAVQGIRFKLGASFSF